MRLAHQTLSTSCTPNQLFLSPASTVGRRRKERRLSPLGLQHALYILNALAPLLVDPTFGRKGSGDGHFRGALAAQLLQSTLLLQVGNAPLLEVLDPLAGAVLVELLGLGAAGDAVGLVWVLEGVVDAVGVEAAEVGVAGGPADLALGAVGDGCAGANGVAAWVRGAEWPHAHGCDFVVVGCVVCSGRVGSRCGGGRSFPAWWGVR